MRICANPNCGEPIEGVQCQGRHHICYSYLKQNGRERPAPASAATPGKKQHKAERIRRAQEYREYLEHLQDARIMAMTPLEKKEEK